MINFRQIGFALLCPFMIAVIGCGAGKGTLSGRVSHDGKPLTSGTVQVFHPDGSDYTSPIQLDGTYSIADIPDGTLVVCVSSPNPVAHYQQLFGFARIEQHKASLKPPSPEIVKSWIAIPWSYSAPESSGLTADISKSLNTHDINLTGPADITPTEMPQQQPGRPRGKKGN